MRTLLKNEFYRAFHNPITALAFGIGTAAALAHVFLHVLPLGKYINSGSYPLSLFQHWIGGENISVWPVLFYLTAPLLGAMPHLRTMYLDRKEGYVKNIFVRTGKMKYCAAKYLATFVSSGVIILWPLVLDFCISALILPALLPQASTGLYPIHQLSLWGSLFYEQPFLYLLLYGGLNFVFFGLLTTLGLPAAYVFDNEFVVLLTPFMVYLITYGVTQLTGTYGYCPFGFLRPSQPVDTTAVIILAETAVMAGIGGVFAIVSAKLETY